MATKGTLRKFVVATLAGNTKAIDLRLFFSRGYNENEVKAAAEAELPPKLPLQRILVRDITCSRAKVFGAAAGIPSNKDLSAVAFVLRGFGTNYAAEVYLQGRVPEDEGKYKCVQHVIEQLPWEFR